MVKIFEPYEKDIGLVEAFLNASSLEHTIRDVHLVPVEEYGSEGLMPLKDRCPEYPETDISCVGGSGSTMCGCYMGEVNNFSLMVMCNGGDK